MPCDYGHSETDPASLMPSLVARMPGIEAKAATYLRDAALQFFQDSGVWRDQRKLLPVSTDQTRYTLPAYYMGEPSQIIQIWALGTPDHPNEWRIPEQREIQSDTDQNWHSPTSNTVSFHIPFSCQTSVRLHVALRPTLKKPRVEPDMLVKYREPIMTYAMKLATLARGQETEDMNTASYYMAEYERLKDKAMLRYKQTLSSDRRSDTQRQRDTRRSRTPRRV